MTADKGMISMMEEKRIFPPSGEVSKKAYIKSMEDYKRIYKESIENPEKFWGELAEQLANI
ncbi:MAG: acetyl-coenzyme A synthetase N-terminal domain-containing protein [Chloroflexota bacterium]|nr:acetyl-coenzyme A synthetase N-terminal domain-containing protein [Chloroflexota bacterium]